MKTSNKLLLTTLLVLLGSLTAYNMALRAEFRRGTYKDPLREYSRLNYKDFDEVSVPAGSVLNVRVEAGPYAVRVSPEAAEYVQVRQQGRQLVVTAAFPDRQPTLFQEAVVISCPRLAAVRTDGLYQKDGRPVRENRTEMGHRVLVQGFRQDTLRVRADRAGGVELRGNRLAYLAATAGATPGSSTVLKINDENHIAAASLTISGQSKLVLNRVRIPGLSYQVGDSVEVDLKGVALNGLARKPE